MCKVLALNYLKKNYRNQWFAISLFLTVNFFRTDPSIDNTVDFIIDRQIDKVLHRGG